MIQRVFKKESDFPEKAGIYRSIVDDLAMEIRTAEECKNELSKHLAKYEENRQRFEAVSTKMEELKGHIENFTSEDKAFFIRELTDTIVLSKTNIGIGYRFLIEN